MRKQPNAPPRVRGASRRRHRTASPDSVSGLAAAANRDHSSTTPPLHHSNSSYWEARYQSGDMPWEKGAPSPGLVDFLAAHPEIPRGKVCVPGCGTGHDVRAFAAAGFDAHGFDIAPSAIQLANEKTKDLGALASRRRVAEKKKNAD